MASRRVWVLVLGGIFLWAGPHPTHADDAAAFAPSTVADLLAHGTEAERLWGRHARDQLTDVERTQVLDCMRAFAKLPQDGGRRARSLPNLRIGLRLRYFLAPRELLVALGVDLRSLLRDAPPYPSEAERSAGPPMLEARPDVDVLARLHAAVADGRLRSVGTAESEDDVGALQTLSVLEPADDASDGEVNALPSGAVLHVQPFFTGPPRRGSLAIRRIVATRRAGSGDARLQIVGSHHPLDPSWGLHVAARDGEVLLLSPRWAVGRAWTGDALPVLELTCRVVPQPADCVVDLGEARRAGKDWVLRRIATIEAPRDGEGRVVFDVPETVRLFFGERLLVRRGEEPRRYVTIIEVVGIRGTRIEARSVPVLEKHAIEAGDHVVWFTHRKD